MPLDPGVLDPQEHDEPTLTGGGQSWFGKKGAPRWMTRSGKPSGGSVTLDGNAEQASREEAQIAQQTVAEIPPATTTNGDDNTMWWVLGGVGVVAVLGVTVAIVASKPKRRRRRRR